jgi:16S rRNA (guanine(966)-N(2))-methyltransferase RsmD
MHNKLTTQILAGKYKGKKLDLPSLEVTRSSKARVKESYFNRIQFDMIDAIFVELFAGSGSVGLEALSRGAKKVYFFEKDKNSYKVLNSNINKLDSSRCEAKQGDTFVLIDLLITTLKIRNEKVYIFLDPPFSYRNEMDEIYTNTLEIIKKLPKEIVEMITIEHMSELALPDNIGIYKKEKVKKFGKTTLTYFKEL